MVWTPKPGFSGVMEDVVVPNVLTIIERDFAEALAHYDFNLPDFAERTLGQVRRKEFPLVSIGPVGNAAEESEDAARHTQPLRISLYLMVVGPEDATNTINIMRYVKVMHGVLNKATKADYFGATDDQVFGFSMKAEHLYSPPLSNKQQLARAATMILTLNFDSR
jgi:hypothetical protein